MTKRVSAKVRSWACKHESGGNCEWCHPSKPAERVGESPAPGTPVCTGFTVNVICHTPDALEKITSPEALRFMIGHMIDSWKLQEEIDYTLEVSRTYGVGESPAPATFEATICQTPCPKCGNPCRKKVGHGDSDGLSGLCWCKTCCGWYVAGETTLISERGESPERVAAPPEPTPQFPYWLDSAKDGELCYQIIHGPLPKGVNDDFGYPIADTMNRHHCIQDYLLDACGGGDLC